MPGPPRSWALLLLAAAAAAAPGRPELLGALCRDGAGAEGCAPGAAGPAVGLLQRTAARGRAGGQRLRLVGAALPKTGTASLQAALELAGGYRVLHGEFVDFRPFHPVWDAWRGGDSVPALELLEGRGFDAVLDSPYCFAYEELMARNPDAKVVLSVHPGGPEAWVRSLAGWMNAHREDTLLTLLWTIQTKVKLNKELFAKELNCDFDKPETDETRRECMEGYVRWQDKVRKAVPRDRLLEFNASDGWEPLCNFLNLPVPDAPFPHKHDQGFGS